jgi:hypothetical protein
MNIAGLVAGCLVSFCNNLGMSQLEALMKAFLPRICFGVRDDIVPLVRMIIYEHMSAH